MSTASLPQGALQGAESLSAGMQEGAGAVVSHTLTHLSPKSIEATVSIWDLFWGATPVVKCVMLLLIAASIWSWTIILSKVGRLRRLHRSAGQFEEAFWSGGALDDLYDRLNGKIFDPMSVVFCAAMKEWRRSLAKGVQRSGDVRHSLQARIERVMHVTINREVDGLERHMSFLATVGSTGMIIGLFGTVIGIMNSFQAIAAQQNANLAVVAPGIAEALFATAIGLIAAIPAMIAYNKISADIHRYSAKLEGFSHEFATLISRQLEEAA